MREISRFFAAAVLLSASMPARTATAQDEFEAYRRQQQQGAQQVQQQFREYKESQDREFAGFLKSQWRDFETFQGKVRIKEPKPKQVPVAPAKPVPEQLPPAAAPGVQVKPAPVTPRPPAPLPEIQVRPAPAAPPSMPPVAVAPVVPPVAPLTPQPKPELVAPNVLEISFYGNPVNFAFDPQWRSYRLSGGVKPEVMSAFWTMMSGSRYEPTIRAIDEAGRALKLDDWGYVTLWRSAVQALQPERKAEQNMLLWFFLIKSGYDVRLGYSGADVYLFTAVRQQIYSTKYTVVGNQTYYAVLAADHGNSIRSFYTYEANYPNTLKPLDVLSASTAFTKPVSAQRTLAFDYRGQTIRINVPYDRRLVEYEGSFPQTEFPLYFDTDGSALLRQGLVPELKKRTAAMGEEAAVNFLLAFVQKAFAYKTDDEQFGYEKYFFVDESLYYPYNDCEDRAVLFTWLVHEVLGIKSVGLLYPGHVTAAVALRQVKPDFATVEYQGSRYVIADPTYIGASVGMAMPSYAGLKPSRVVETMY